MKKILSLILVFGLIASLGLMLVSCGDDTPDIYRLAKDRQPTRVVTAVEYTGQDGLTLKGWYDLQVDGEDAIFTYEYERLRTAEEAIAEGTTVRVKVIKGTVYCQDGKYSVDGVNWDASPVETEIQLNLDPGLLSDAVISEDGRTLTALISPDNAEAVIGTTLSAVGDISLTATTNGVFFTGLVLSCTTIEGATLVVRTSYSRNEIDLVFPES